MAELIRNRFEIPATSMGAILRTEAKRGAPIGLQAAKIIATGALAPDEIFRMKEYREKTVPVTDFYDGRGIFARVDANRSFELVFEDAGELIAG